VIHEFALEPELVAGLTERSAARYLAENFGLGQPRLVSRYPKRWKALAWEAFQQTYPNCSEGKRKVVEELIQRLSERMVRRADASWEPSRSWLENAEQEHDRRPFRGILARANPRSRAEVLIDGDLDEQSSSRWAAVRGASVERKARSMAELVLPLLRCCGQAIFVDPHFGPENLRHRRPLEAFLSVLVDGRSEVGSLKVEVHAEVKSTADFFRSRCQDQLGRCIPAGLSVRLRRWTQRPGGEALHNRYILTDLGGLIFSHGLDEGSTGETDDVSLMDREQYILRWNQYASNTPAFDSTEEPVVVVGTKRL
jgi:hypothetical protein